VDYLFGRGGGFVKKYKVGIIGGTGMVGQRFVSLLAEHPWFEIAEIAASSRSAGRTYDEVVASRWALKNDMPEIVKNIVMKDASDVKAVSENVDFVFSAVNMDNDEIVRLEESYAKLECPVVSNNSANRLTPDVPMIIPEVNPEHLNILDMQKKRLGTKRGFIAVKSNCSIQSYVPALEPFRKSHGIDEILVCTYQAISGAGKTFESWPEMIDNVIPFIGGEEEKSEIEPLKVWGNIGSSGIILNDEIKITSQCIRVPVLDGHMAAVFVKFKKPIAKDEILSTWQNFSALPQTLKLPTAPKPAIKYFYEENRPQTGLDRMNENGMQFSVGRLREDKLFNYKFVCLSHNTLRGAAGGAVLLAELLCAQGYI
jgi:aspartate-semialdehyde dehydrogenase